MVRLHFFAGALCALALGACAAAGTPSGDEGDAGATHADPDAATSRSVDADSDRSPDEPGPDPDPYPEAPCGVPLDILFVVDNSDSMVEEQNSLAAQFPSLIQSLVSPPDHNGDGQPDWRAIVDVHVGVISSDMGAGGYSSPGGCADADFGDDGLLRRRSNLPGCSTTYPSFLRYTSGQDRVGELGDDFECIARMGTGGCGFEQPLEAALKALTPSSSSTRFFRGTRGHGDDENDDFLRPDSMLAIVVLTDENDCSAADGRVFDPIEGVYTGFYNHRCFLNPTALHPVSRYVDGFRRLRGDRPDLFSFAVIAGVPTDLVGDPRAVDYTAILADPRMEERIDPRDWAHLVPSCEAPGLGRAFPPRRLVETARALGERAIVQSICQQDLSPVMGAIAGFLGEQVCGPI